MGRNNNPGSLRNRNRITPKTRLKIHKGDIDAEPVVLEEDEEKARVVSTAGVDAEDANEHHLQAVLSAASHRHHPSNLRPRSSSTTKKPEPSEAYIPTPDAAGIVADKDLLYPPNQWKDPSSYVRSSDTVDEAIDGALNDGYTYFMDERDQEWLEKNNEEARGEGTSTQGAVSSTPRLRASKKGKEPDVSPSVSMTEDEFELIMGVFERITHDKTEHLHLSLETGMDFPAFVPDYEDAFSHDLPISLFAAFSVPSWVPPPASLLKLARAVYPHWKERRLERGGHRISPALNFDESDTKNESYVCFRRREVKSVRKTRASQVAYSEKLLRLQQELGSALELAHNLLQRELVKKDVAEAAHAVWDQRSSLIDIRRKIPSLSPREDEEMFFDKEIVIRKPVRPDAPSIRLPTKPRLGDALLTPAEAVIRPRERFMQITAQVENEMAQMKDKDKGDWEDGLDNPYQTRPVPYGDRLFKYATSSAPRTTSSGMDSRQVRGARALRLRVGRGGRLHLDRRQHPLISPDIDTRRLLTMGDSEHSDDSEATALDSLDYLEEDRRRLEERWKFDEDDSPPVGSIGVEEQDRVLFDDYQAKYLVHTAKLLKMQDHVYLTKDLTVAISGPTGQTTRVLPEAIKYSQQIIHRSSRMGNPLPPFMPNGQPPPGMQPLPQGTPVSTMKRVLPMSQSRISLNGQASATQLPNGANGPLIGQPEHIPGADLDSSAMVVDTPVPIARPKSIAVPSNGYPHMTNTATYIAHTATNGGPGHPLSDIKSAFAGVSDLTAMQNAGRPGGPGFPTHVVANGTNFNVPMGSPAFNLKLPPTRQTQWAASRGNGDMSIPANGSPALSHAQMQAAFLAVNAAGISPTRTPSGNRGRASMGPDAAQMVNMPPPSHLAALQRSPHVSAAHGSPAPGMLALSPHHSPMRLGPSPVPPSPSMQPITPPIPASANGY